MVQAEKTVPRGKYILVIIISVLMVIIAFAGAGLAATYLITEIIKGKGKIDLASGMSVLCLWLPVVWIVLTGATYYPLAKKRQQLRDLCEYDRFGNLRKSFSTMSSEQRKHAEQAKMVEIQRVIPDSLIKSCTHEGPKDPDAEMEKLIGLGQVRNEVLEMKAQLEFDKTDKKKDNKKTGGTDGDVMHMVFYGPPGTGKTTFARIITSYLYQYGIIKKNKCIEIDGNMVKGNTARETNMKMTRFLQSAIGGVLFIDEAYALARYKGENTAAVATLIKFMEDYRSEFVLILAGYENEMKQLIASNPGFKSRVRYFNFPSYTMPELREIFMKMAGEEGYAVDGDAYPMFDEIMEQERKKRDFGNARTVRKCLSASIRKHKSNFMNNVISPEARYRLCREDISYDKDFI